MKPIGKWRVEEPAKEVSASPKGKWRVESPATAGPVGKWSIVPKEQTEAKVEQAPAKEEAPVSTVRGMRNNNPGNIRHSKDEWEGASKEQGDESFVQFDSMEMGVRSLGKNLLTSLNKHGNTDIASIITRWAPPEENDTEAYIASVVSHTGLQADQKLSEDDLTLLASAIIRHENGEDVDEETVKKGMSLAFDSK